MNKARRKELSKLSTELMVAETNEDIQSCINVLESIMNDEQDYFDNMPENLQGSMRGMDSEEAISNMESAIDSMNEALETDDDDERKELIEDAIGLIEDAIGLIEDAQF